ncbi:MAG: HD domain-containing protein, partial [Streptosporangiaceae bacterium]
MTSLDVDATTTESWWRRLVSGGSGRGGLPAVESLVQAHRQHHPKADAAVLRKACMLAAKLHAGQVRKSGEPYVSHPFAVAQLLAEMGLD